MDVRTGSSTAWKVRRSSMPSTLCHRTWILMPCQSASNRRCGFRRLAIPEKALHGRSLRNGVKFSVQTCSEGRDAWRSWWGTPQSGRLPSGWNESTGDVVRCSSSAPRDAQNNPERALRRPFQRSSTLQRQTEQLDSRVEVIYMAYTHLP